MHGRLQSFLLNPICFPALAQCKAADSFMITTPPAPALLGPAMPVRQLGSLVSCEAESLWNGMVGNATSHLLHRHKT